MGDVCHVYHEWHEFANVSAPMWHICAICPFVRFVILYYSAMSQQDGYALYERPQTQRCLPHQDQRASR